MFVVLFSTASAQNPAAAASAETYFEQASRYFSGGDLEKALETFRLAEKLDAGRFEIQYNIGTTLFLMQRFDESAAAFAKAVRLNPQKWDAHLRLCRAQASSGKIAEAVESCKAAARLNPAASEPPEDLAFIYTRSQQYAEAFPILLKLLETRQNDVKLLMQLNEVYVNQGNLDEALETQQKIARLDPNINDVYLVLSETYNKLGKIKESLDAAKEYIKRVPNDSHGYLQLGRTLAENGGQQEAIPVLQKSAEISPGFWYVHYLLGDSYKAVGDAEKSAASFQKAVALNPNEPVAASDLAKALNELKRYDEAIEAAKNAVRLRPQLIENHALLGMIYTNTGRFDEAIASFTNAQRISPDSEMVGELLRVARVRRQEIIRLPEALEEAAKNPKSVEAGINLAEIYALKRDFKKAEAEYLEALKYEPKNYELNNLIAVFYSDFGKSELAIRYFQAAVEQKKHHVLYLSLSGELEKAGKLDEAIEAAKQSAEIKPEFAEAHLRLGDLWQKKGNREEALSAYQRAFALNNLDTRTNTRLAILYVKRGNKEAAMRHYDLLKSQNRQAAADVLRYITVTFGR